MNTKRMIAAAVVGCLLGLSSWAVTVHGKADRNGDIAGHGRCCVSNCSCAEFKGVTFMGKCSVCGHDYTQHKR